MKILLSFLILITFALLTGPVTAAEPTPVNGQVTDADTKTNVKGEGDAPAEAMGKLYKPTSDDLDNGGHNGTTSQQDSTTGGTKEIDKEGKGEAK